jgi:hypothetical protein
LNNDRRIIRAPHLFVVDARSGIEPQASIYKAVKSAGYALEKIKGEKGSVLGPNALLFAYTLGATILEKTLFDLAHSWGNSADGRAVAALAPLIAANPGVYEQDRMRAILGAEDNDHDTIMKEARQAAASSVLKKRNPQPRDTNPYATRIIAARYNYKLPLKEGRRLDIDGVETLACRFEGHHELYGSVYKFHGER